LTDWTEFSELRFDLWRKTEPFEERRKQSQQRARIVVIGRKGGGEEDGRKIWKRSK
jgi:hypothetical protein